MGCWGNFGYWFFILIRNFMYSFLYCVFYGCRSGWIRVRFLRWGWIFQIWSDPDWTSRFKLHIKLSQNDKPLLSKEKRIRRILKTLLGFASGFFSRVGSKSESGCFSKVGSGSRYFLEGRIRIQFFPGRSDSDTDFFSKVCSGSSHGGRFRNQILSQR